MRFFGSCSSGQPARAPALFGQFGQLGQLGTSSAESTAEFNRGICIQRSGWSTTMGPEDMWLAASTLAIEKTTSK